MNKLLTFALFLTTVFAGGYKELLNKRDKLDKIIEYVDFCQEKFSVSSDTIDAILDPKIPFPEDEENAKCFMKCVQEKREFINEKGELQLHEIESGDKKPNLMREVFKKCQEIVVATCDDALKLEKCMMETMKEEFKKRYS